MTAGKPPTLRLERELAAGGRLVAGMDEVGRGCLAGPVSVGVVVVDHSSGRQPGGLRDSKLLTAAAREHLVPAIRRWALAGAVGHASPAEIDEVGIIAALRLAGHRAMARVRHVLPSAPGILLLDGNHDWYSAPQEDLFASLAQPADGVVESDEQIEVLMKVKADLTCASVAAASVLAKVERDGLMRAAHEADPRYDWAGNKGYAAPTHIAALAEHGASNLHRRSWRLPGIAGATGGMMVS